MEWLTLLLVPALTLLQLGRAGHDLWRAGAATDPSRRPRRGLLVAAILVLTANLALMTLLVLLARADAPMGHFGWAVFTFAAGFIGLTALGTALHLLATPRAHRSEERTAAMQFLFGCAFLVGGCYGVLFGGSAIELLR